MRPALAAIAIPLALAACAKSDGTSVTINSSDGNTVASMNGNSGEVALNVPGFSGKITLPKVQVNAEHFDLNGVHLYPGSTIQSLNVAAGKNDGGAVRVAFTSPASPQVVRDWLMQRLNKADFTLVASGQGLAGTTDENKPFRLDLTAIGADKSRGVMTLGS